MNDIHEKLNAYGVSFEGEQGPYIPTEEEVTLAELAARGGRIVRVRWIGGDYVPGRGKCYDLSYVHGVIAGGTCTTCNGRGCIAYGGGENFGTSYCSGCDGSGQAPEVRVRVSHLPAAFLVPRSQRKGALIGWAKEEGVFAKGLGLLEEANWSTLG